MYLTIKQQLKHLSKDEYKILRELCRASKNLMNEALYVNRKHFFRERKHLGYETTYAILKTSENYRILNSNMAQQSMKVVDGMFASFIALLRLVKKKQYSSKAVKLPHYLPKDGYAPLIIQQFTIRNQIFTLPYSKQYGAEHSKLTVRVPPILEGKKVKYIRIIPINDARFFEIQYIYEVIVSQRELDKNKALAIDFGLDNLMTCATIEGDTFIIDGRKLKAINQCLLNGIGVLACGYNVTFQKDVNMGRINNQNFVNIPYGKIRQKLAYLCELYGIKFHVQEESYTSKASFWDKDEMPIYSSDNTQKYEFSGSRIRRRVYRTSTGFEFNADVNGALNILRKSNVVSLIGLYSPLRVLLGADWPRP